MCPPDAVTATSGSGKIRPSDAGDENIALYL